MSQGYILAAQGAFCGAGFPSVVDPAAVVALAAGVPSAAIDTGIVVGQLGILTMSFSGDPGQPLDVLFGPSAAVPAPVASDYSIRTIVGNRNFLVIPFAVDGSTRFFRVRAPSNTNLHWQVQQLTPGGMAT